MERKYSSIVFLRSAEATRSKKCENDLTRQLTEKGCAQVPRNLGKFDLVFSSPAMRALETARITSRMEPTIIKSLSPYLWNGTRTNGNLSLEDLYKEISDDEKHSIILLSEEMFGDLDRIIRDVDKPGLCVLVVGHAILLPTLLRACALNYKGMPGGYEDEKFSWNTIIKNGGSYLLEHAQINPSVIHVHGREKTLFKR